MSKKQDFIRSEQSRDKHPDRMMKGSAAQQAEEQARAQAKGNPADFQVPHSGKVANDRNKQGEQSPTQLHQSQRSPESRHDRQTVNGTMNVTQARTGGKGGGRGSRGGGSVGGGSGK